MHVNTMRYRLRRIREVSGVDFANADAVLLAHLQLRLAAMRGAVVDANDTANPAS
ncbi:helix-turn-helix domain-containing protein [Streptomyces sioyaensis]|uniref:helix-turn-helix domain-containing protein n=1 Tax=Streptomyces sioyaensis TaxID=67364 RepID=UPI003D7160EC